MFIAIALDLIATPMVIEMAETPESLVQALYGWVLSEKGDPTDQIHPEFEQQVIEACNVRFAGFNEITEQGFPVIKLPGQGDDVSIAIQRYDAGNEDH